MSKLLTSNRHLIAFTISASVTIPGLLAVGFLNFPADSVMRWLCFFLAALVLVMSTLAYVAGRESGEIKGWNDSYDANNQPGQKWIFKNEQ